MDSNAPSWIDVQPASSGRYLPVYLLLDTSSSMNGTAIESLRQGIEQFRNESLADQFSRDTVRVGIITFNSEAQLVTDGLVSLSELEIPKLVACGVTRLDRAFEVLQQSIDQHVTRPVKGGAKGDWKPMVFVLTDGQPTNDRGYADTQQWQIARDTVVNRPKGKTKPSTVVAVGCGTDVDEATVKAISTGTAFTMGKDDASFKAFFLYVTMSSSLVASGTADDPNGYDPFPDLDELNRIP